MIINLFTTDIITNSSSVTYTFATGTENAFKMLDAVLKAAGVEKSAKELFDIVIIPDDWYVILESIDEGEFADYATLPCKVEDIEYQGKFYDKRHEILGKFIIDAAKAGYKFKSNREVNSSYLVLAKDGKETNIGALLDKLFESETYG